MTGIYFAFPGPFNALIEAFTAQGTETPTSMFLEDVLAWVVQLHFGRSFGPGIMVTWAVLGLVPCLLFITGVVMWWNRVLRTTRA